MKHLKGEFKSYHIVFSFVMSSVSDTYNIYSVLYHIRQY